MFPKEACSTYVKLERSKQGNSASGGHKHVFNFDEIITSS